MNLNIEVSDDKIRNLLCTAFEGGSNYWYQIKGQVLRGDLSMVDFREGGKMQTAGDYWHWSQLIPLVDGCAILMTTKFGDELNGKKEWCLDKDAIASGLAIMREKYPKHFGDFVAENDDAITGDVFLQCCLFGEVVYG